MSNNFENTPDKISKNRTTLNSSKLKDQDTASGMTKTNSLQQHSSMQESEIDKHINDDDQVQDNIDQRCNSVESDGKGWNVFKLKTWKNIFTRSNDRSEERIENEDEQKMDKSVSITN